VFSIFLSLLMGLVVGGTFRLTGLVHSVAGAITPGVIATLITAVFLLRRVGNLINPLVEEAQRHLQGGRRELALKALRSGMRLAPWHPLIAPQLRTQIGVLLYAGGDLDGAIPELARGSKRPWEGRAFLGCAYFRKKMDDSLMVKAFETATKVAPKEGIAWTLYAYCLAARGKKDAAVAVLKRGLAANPGDGRIEANIELTETGKKLKVAPYGNTWAAFGLDGSQPVPANVPKAMRGFAQRPGFRQKPQRKR